MSSATSWLALARIALSPVAYPSERSGCPLTAASFRLSSLRIGRFSSERLPCSNAKSAFWEIGGHRTDHGLQALLRDTSQVVVVPPRLRHMMIGQNLPVIDDEPCSKEVGSHFWRLTLERINDISVAVLQRFAVVTDCAVSQRPSRSSVDECHRNMQQAHTWPVGTDHVLGSRGLGFYSVQPACRFIQSLA